MQNSDRDADRDIYVKKAYVRYFHQGGGYKISACSCSNVPVVSSVIILPQPWQKEHQNFFKYYSI